MFQSFNPAPSVEFSLCAASVAEDPKFGSLKPFSAMNVNQKDKENVCDSRPENLTIISARPISNVAPQKLASQQAGKPESYTKPTASSRDKSKQGFVPNSAGGKMQWNASCNLESVRRPCAVAPPPPGQGQSVQIAALLGQINAQQRQLEALQRDLDIFKNQPRENDKSGSVLQDVTSNLNNLAISAQNGGSREVAGVAPNSDCPRQNSDRNAFEEKPLRNMVSQGVQCSLCCCDQKRAEEADSKIADVGFVTSKELPVKRPANAVSDEPRSFNPTEPSGKTMTDQEKEFFMEMKRKLACKSQSQAPAQRFAVPEMALMNARAIDACDNRLVRRDAFTVAPSAQATQLDDANNGQMASSVSIHMNALAGKYLQQLPTAPSRRQSQDFSPGKSSMFSVSVAKKAVTTVKQFSFFQQVPQSFSAPSSAETEAEQHLQRVRALQQTALQFDSGAANFNHAPPRALTYEGGATNFAPGGIYQRADAMNLQRAGGQFQYQQQHMRQQDPIPFLSTIEECSSEFYYSPPGSMRPSSCVCEGFPRNRSDCAQCMPVPPFY